VADDDRIWEHMTLLGRGPEFDRWFDDSLAARDEGKRVPFAVRLQSTQELIGSTGYIDPMPMHKRIEIGWTWYRYNQWATAVNPECKLILMTHAFETLGFNRVSFVTDLRNTRSQAAIAKLGAIREGVMRSHAITRGGRVRDSVLFAIVATDWPAVKQQLMARLAELREKTR
jgi:RimJ/RimL family protein N-acetyltransferase